MTAGPEADVSHAGALIEGVAIEGVIADKGDDGKAVVGAIEARGGEAVIPSRKNRAEPRAIDRDRYKDRNLGERSWSKVKQYRPVATRYEKTARHLLAFVPVASIMIPLR